MLLQRKTLSICMWLLLWSAGLFGPQTQYLAEDRVAADFKKLLNRPRVALRASFQSNKTDSVIIETGYIYSEKDEKVPILIYKPVTQAKSFPAVIFLHGTGGTKDARDIKNILYQLSKRGIIGVAIDARYHG